jgi:hypothetical protein
MPGARIFIKHIIAAKPVGIAGKIIPVLMAGMFFGLPCCRSERGQLPLNPVPDTFAKSPQPTHTEGPGGDGSYEHFMDSIIVRKDIVYDTTSIEAGEVWLWDEQEGAYPKEPKTFHFGSTYFDMTTHMDVVNEEGVVVGKLESFSDNGMQYLFDVRMSTGEIVTLPYVDAFFPDIDMENKKITMIMPDYTE